MRYLLNILLLICFLSLDAYAQTADQYFHQSAQMYTQAKDQYAKKLLDEGLMRFPNDPKLSALREKIKEDEKKKEEEQKKKDQQDQQDQQNKDQQGQDQQQDQSDQQEQDKEGEQEKQDKEGEEQEGEQQEGEKKEGEQKEGEQKEGEENDKDGKPQKPTTSEKLEAMNVTEEKAKQILEALKNKEAQYLQQTRKKATKKKDNGKPDW